VVPIFLPPHTPAARGYALDGLGKLGTLDDMGEEEALFTGKADMIQEIN